MKIHIRYRATGLGLMAFGVALLPLFPILFPALVRLFEQYISSDHQLTASGRWALTVAYFVGVIALTGLGFVLTRWQDPLWRAKLARLYLAEPLCCFAPIRPSPRKVLLLSSLIGIFLIACRLLAYQSRTVYLILFWKDRGILDLMVPVSMVVSAVLMAQAVRRLWRNPGCQKKWRVLLSLVYAGLIAAFIFYAGEETSWGQDFFRWETPQAFAGNLESQTNLHNYFNPYFVYGYVALSLVLVVVLASVWMEVNQRWLTIKRCVFPHPSMIGLGVLIALVALVWYAEQELLEEMTAVFVLFYSLRVSACFRSPYLVIEPAA